jgi:hypothetical protein
MDEEVEEVKDSTLANVSQQSLLAIRTNPWSVDHVDEFLFYCCPQCDHKYKSKNLFVDHAFLNHPEVIQIF